MDRWTRTLVVAALLVAAAALAACPDGDGGANEGGLATACEQGCAHLYRDCRMAASANGRILSEADCVTGCPSEEVGRCVAEAPCSEDEMQACLGGGGGGASGGGGAGGGGGTGGTGGAGGAGGAGGTGGAGGVGGTGGGGGLDALAAAVCGKQAECCQGWESSEGSCRSTVDFVFGAIFELPTMAVDPAGLAACLERLAGASCERIASYERDWDPILGECERFWSGTVAEGGACDADAFPGALETSECASGGCAGGACVPPSGPGGPCGADRPCTGELGCSLGTCEVAHVAGEACLDTGLCVAPLACFAAVEGAERTCGEPVELAVGEDCGAGKRCTLGEDQCSCRPGEEGCVFGACGTSRRCANGG